LITPGIYRKRDSSLSRFLNVNNELRCWNWGNGWSGYSYPDEFGWYFEERHKKDLDYKIAPWTLGTWSD
jgi:hypothetical protein